VAGGNYDKSVLTIQEKAIASAFVTLIAKTVSKSFQNEGPAIKAPLHVHLALPLHIWKFFAFPSGNEASICLLRSLFLRLYAAKLDFSSSIMFAIMTDY
jgi:hypothetical protein